jgi:lipopolysaccharide/colanic/teichoic acid biosynthesis glycosyltransferase
MPLPSATPTHASEKLPRASTLTVSVTSSSPRWLEFRKRVLDVLLSAFLIVILSPALFLISIIVCADGGPVLYAHRRVKRGGAEFSCLKFRTMSVHADRQLEALLSTDPVRRQEWTVARKLRDDPRITQFGRLLRVTSSDELPQLFNVLCGDMSLVGPRPVTHRELEEFYGQKNAAAYLSVRPGITGLWQVSGRNDLGYEKRIALDLLYVRRMSLRLDLIILWRTIGAVLRGRGAC